MPGIFRDGFDSYNSSAAPVGFLSKWTNVSSGSTLVAGRFGGQALRISGSSIGRGVRAVMDAATSALMICFGLRAGSNPGWSYGNIVFLSGTTHMLGIGIGADGSISAYRQTGDGAGTLLGSSAPGKIVTGVYHTVEVIATISDTTGLVTIKVDGATVLTLTNVDTRNGTPTTVDTIQLYASSGGSFSLDFDDIYVKDSASFLSKAVRIETLVPNADSTPLDWTPSTGTSHFAVVDELPAATSDYLQASTVGNIDELELSNLSSTPSAVEEVCIVGYLNKTDAVNRSAYLGVKSGATTSQGTAVNLNQTGLRHERALASDPNTSAAWGAAAINALKVRPEVAS